MALAEAVYGSPPNFNVRAVRGGSAAEMVSNLTNEIIAAAAAGESVLVDFILSGAGSGPDWVACLTTSSEGEPITVDPINTARFVASVAGSTGEALLRLKQRLAAATPGVVYKVEVAGAGDGPTYMAVALFAPPT